MLHNDQSQYVFAQSKHQLIMAVIHLYSLTDQLDQVTDTYQFRLLNWKNS